MTKELEGDDIYHRLQFLDPDVGPTFGVSPHFTERLKLLEDQVTEAVLTSFVESCRKAVLFRQFRLRLLDGKL